MHGTDRVVDIIPYWPPLSILKTADSANFPLLFSRL